MFSFTTTESCLAISITDKHIAISVSDRHIRQCCMPLNSSIKEYFRA